MTFSDHHSLAKLDEPSPTPSPLKGSLLTLGLGALTAPLLGVIPLMGWFIGALCHEMGTPSAPCFPVARQCPASIRRGAP
ncbi:MAG: hypothetical protein ACI8QS_003544 [Planctomycetota bacterium]|jgi:hypothetical protein